MCIIAILKKRKSCNILTTHTRNSLIVMVPSLLSLASSLSSLQKNYGSSCKSERSRKLRWLPKWFHNDHEIMQLDFLHFLVQFSFAGSLFFTFSVANGIYFQTSTYDVLTAGNWCQLQLLSDLRQKNPTSKNIFWLSVTTWDNYPTLSTQEGPWGEVERLKFWDFMWLCRAEKQDTVQCHWRSGIL